MLKSKFILNSKVIFFLSAFLLGISLLTSEVKKDSHAFRDFESFFYAGKDILNHKNIYSLDLKQEIPTTFIPGFETNDFLLGTEFLLLPKIPALGEFEYLLKTVIGVDVRTASPFFTYPYIYPPLLACILSLVVSFGFSETYFIWIILSFLTISFYPLTSEKFLQKRLTLDSKFFFPMGILSLFILGFSIYDNFIWTQVNIFVTYLLMISLNYEEKNFTLAGFCFAFACMIKMSPVILIVYFVSKKKWKFLFATFLSLSILFLFTILIGGLKDWEDFFAILPDISKGDRIIRGLFPIGIPGNFSLKAYIYRTLPTNVQYIEAGFMVISCLLIFYSMFEFFQKKFAQHSDSVFLFRLLFLTYILSPIAWLHHMIFLYPACLLFLTFIFNSKIKIQYKTFISILFIISFVPAWLYLKFLPEIKNIFLINQLNSLNFILLLLVFFIPDFLLSKSRSFSFFKN